MRCRIQDVGDASEHLQMYTAVATASPQNHRADRCLPFLHRNTIAPRPLIRATESSPNRTVPSTAVSSSEKAVREPDMWFQIINWLVTRIMQKIPHYRTTCSDVYVCRYANMGDHVQGSRSQDVPLFSVSQPSFLHDFAITENYAIFCDIQIVMQPLQMSDRDIRWFDVPGFNPVHTINEWEEDGGATVVLVAPNVLSLEHVSGQDGACRQLRGDGNLDFGVINTRYLGRRHRYAYLCLWDPQPMVAGVVKIDMEKKGGDCVAASRMYDPGRFGGELIFVPAPDEGEGEDDGYLVTFLHDENTRKSSFLVMDARSPDLEVVAEVSLPRRVPYSFHGLFVTAEDLRAQRGKS
ncbi:unnamed protein product [Spirodela intermedia]|uniref:Uncharacterized protein n=1 Tax=Spirodela intermedia TaxID=51605 RepID=A0A7I8JLH4_SPIIN|nr:unnamed protein product [Spirodela intermedia]CAA6670423.1 unnamed protein product [Spirodela intermedia]